MTSEKIYAAEYLTEDAEIHIVLFNKAGKIVAEYDSLEVRGDPNYKEPKRDEMELCVVTDHYDDGESYGWQMQPLGIHLNTNGDDGYKPDAWENEDQFKGNLLEIYAICAAVEKKLNAKPKTK